MMVGHIYGMTYNAFEIVKQFEESVAEYAGSKYAVAVDTCTAAIFLCCKYLKAEEVVVPNCTFISVPSSIIHAGGKVKFESVEWQGAYQLKPYPIWDSALRFRKNMFLPKTYWCVSFQYRKHVPIGRGGMILTDDEEAVKWFKLARFHGRHEVPMMEDVPEMIGWNFYMEPNRAATGLALMMHLPEFNEDLQIEYPDLSKFEVFNV